MMTTSRRTQSALRAALQKEDAALAKRLPDAVARRATTSAKDSPGSRAGSEQPPRKAATRRGATGVSAAGKVDAVVRKPMSAEPPSGGVARGTVSPETGALAEAAVVEPPGAEPPKAEKRVCEDFVLSVKDVERLRQVQSAVEKAAPRPSRSALLRVAVRLLGELDPATLATGLDGLPPLKKKGKRRKK